MRSSYRLFILPWLKAEEDEESAFLRRRLLFFFLRLLFLLLPPPRFASAGETKRRTTKKSRRTDNKDLLMISAEDVLEIVRNEKILPDALDVAERAFRVDFGHNSCPLLNGSYLC